jgi:hypothetical protein
VNPHSQYTLKVWFFDVGYLYLLVVALVVFGFVIKSMDPQAISSAGINQQHDIAAVEPR